MEAAGPDALRRFTANYSAEALGPELSRQISGMYVAAYLRAPGNKGSNELATILGAVRAAKEAGFEPENIPDLKIAFLEVTSKTLLKEGQIDFPAEINVDLPADIAKAEIDEALSNPTSKTADHLIVSDIALAKEKRRVLGIKGEYWALRRCPRRSLSATKRNRTPNTTSPKTSSARRNSSCRTPKCTRNIKSFWWMSKSCFTRSESH